MGQETVELSKMLQGFNKFSKVTLQHLTLHFSLVAF